MAFTNRYSNIIKGALTFTGNTSGLSKFENQNNQGTVASIGAFTSLNDGLVVNNFPNGTTLDISENGSSANLVIPADSTIIYAELIWGGNYFGQDGNNGQKADISSLIDNPVKLTTTLGTNSINPDPITSINQTESIEGGPYGNILSFYARSQNVTSLIAPLGSGTHLISVTEIPGLTEPIDNISKATNHAGWTLAVVYRNKTLSYRSLNIWVGGEIVRANKEPVDINISGFATPALGMVNARLLISAQEGDADIVGDQLFFGPTIETISPVSGPNNPVNNFFASQINGDNGNLNTSGTFGDRNQNPFTLTNVSGGRQGWDITNVNISSLVNNNQTSALLRLSTVGDTYMPNTIGVQIDVNSPNIDINKSVNKSKGIKGDRLLYTIVINNTGTSATDNFNLLDLAPAGTKIDVSTINVLNATGPLVNNSTKSTIDLQLGAILVDESVTVQYEVITNDSTPTPVTNNAQGNFEFTFGVGQKPIKDQINSNTVTTDLAFVTQTKAVSNSEALVGDVVTYTIKIDNSISLVDLNNVFLFDNLQLGTSYVAGSTVINGDLPINADPSISPGINIGNVQAGAIIQVSFDVRVDAFPKTNPILNSANVSFTVGESSITQSTNKTEVLVLKPDITVTKSVDKKLAKTGDVLTYTVRVTNAGDTPLENIIFDDKPPINTTFISNTVMINGKPYPGLDPNVKINFLSIPITPNIFPLLPGNFVDISYQVNVDSIPNPPQIKNIGNVYYDFLVDKVSKRLNEESNEVITEIFNITISKSVDKVVAEGGDILRYTSTINTTIPGNYGDPIIFKDLIPNETSLVPGSISVSGASFTDSSTLTEVILNFGEVFPKNSIVVKFDVLIDDNANGPILNTSQVNLRTDVTKSNEIQTNLVNPSVSKSVSQNNALVGDVVTYTVTIDNSKGQASIKNVYVIDNLQLGTSYVNGTTSIDENIPINSNPAIAPGIPVGVIPAGQIQTVSFDVKIDSLPSINPIQNIAIINYSVDGEEKTITTNKTNVLVKSPDINIVKSTNKLLAQVGEIITYTSVITNTGTINIDNIIFNDLPPINTVYDGNGVTIQGTNYPDLDPNDSIDLASVNPGLFPLVPGESRTISFSVIINNMPNPPQVQNISSADYLFTVNNVQKTLRENSNEVITKIYELDIVKSVDKFAAEGGDTLTYTFTINSNISGNIGVPINFVDNIPAETSLVADSIEVIGLPTFVNNSVLGQINLNLGNIIPENPIVLKFNVIVDKNATGPIFNQSKLNANGIIISSNQVRTDIVNLNVNKNALVKEVEVGEIITYTVTIDNSQNDVGIDNVFVFDNLQSGTSYVAGSTVINDNLPISDNPSVSKGINIGSVPARAITKVSFDVRVDVLPNPNPILNTANVNYEVAGESKNKTTNETQVKVVDMTIVKSSSPEFVQVGDKITYRSKITNSGQVPIENVIFNDSPPANTSYYNQSFKVNGILYPNLNPEIPINLSLIIPSIFPLKPGESIDLEFDVILDALPDIPIIENIASIDYSYFGGSILKTVSIDSNLVDTVIREGKVTLEKKVNKDVALVGDVLTYTINVKSVGNIEVNNLVLKDIVPLDTEFIDGSVVVNGVNYKSLNPEKGINLGTIPASLTHTVSFEVKVLNLPSSGEIINKSTASYDVFVNPNGPSVKENVISNDVITKIKLLSIQITKICNPKCVSIGDEIEFKFNIVNKGMVDISNIKFFDNIPEETSFVEGSFIGAEGIVKEEDLIKGASIGILNAGESKELSFKVKLERILCRFNIINKAEINYYYTLNNGKTFENSSSISNECIISITRNSFKQTFTDVVLNIPEVKPNIESIVDVCAEFICEKYSIINTPKGISQEGQNLSGKKLLVNGKLCVKVLYVAELEEQTVHTAHFEICLCEYIVIPKYKDLECIIKPNIKIEDVLFEKINNRQVFVNIMYIIESGL